MNKTYLYDGKLSSLLALIFIIIENEDNTCSIKTEQNYMPSLLDKPVYLNITNKQEKIDNLKKLLTPNIIRTIRYVFLSDDKNKEDIILEFVKVAIKHKNKIYYMRNLDIVNKVYKLSHKVTMETHHIKGFLRFKKMRNNFYYAEINPTNNIISLITLHFKERLKNEYWIIKDVNRNIYAIYDLKKIIYLEQKDIIKLNLDLSTDENNIEDLWKTFFKTVAIKERENKKCQMNFMPKKYWDYIIEMENQT